MGSIRSLLAMDFGFGGNSDISSAAHVVHQRGAVDVDRKRRRLRIGKPGFVEVDASEALAGLDSFTLELDVTPDEVGRRQQVLEAQNPPISVAIDETGRLTGAVHTTKGWETVDSGLRRVADGEELHLRLIHDASGQLKLEIDDQHAGSVAVAGTLVPTGDGGIVLGTRADLRTDQFVGELGTVRLRNGAIDALGQSVLKKTADALALKLKGLLGYDGQLGVEPDPDAVDHRFDTIKGILSSAGVADVSALAELRIDKRTVIQPNSLMVAPLKSQTPSIDWAGVATTIATADVATAVLSTATTLPNRNSRLVLSRAAAGGARRDTSSTSLSGSRESEARAADASLDSAATVAAGSPVDVRDEEVSAETTATALSARTAGSGAPLLSSSSARLANIRPTSLRTETPLSERARPIDIGPASSAVARFGDVDALRGRRSSEIIRPARGVEIRDPEILSDLERPEPGFWPVHSSPVFLMGTITSVPVNTSVIIAGRLDLTNQELVIEPSVETLYIIAEEIVGDVNASITWRRPGGFTPSKTANSANNGRSYSGVHTASGSRNGLRGGDGLDGDPGLGAQGGIDAPNLEVWVKQLTAMPDIDLNGEDGIRGGRGQRGGRGGHGARGAGGEWWWAFGVHCWKSPGHGGNGGHGGDGGRGGPGGDGGRGGNIRIGVLEGTLAESITAKVFKVKNQGGQGGQGGLGGSGGTGGQGGTHGNDYVNGEEVCGNGVDGTRGAQGQPGAAGVQGRVGQDGTVDFFEFTEESWDEQLTRPWLYALTPTQVFPGNELIITGTRFADTDRVIFDGTTLVTQILADESLRVYVPSTATGGEKELYVQRYDGPQSNRLRVWIKPQLEPLVEPLVPGGTATLRGEAFAAGAAVLYDDTAVPANSVTRTQLTFTVPSAGTGDTAEQNVTVAVRNPDGLTSNERTATLPRIIDSGLQVDVHGLSFGNFDDGTPSWSTFEDTFGTLEVWHELLDPVFGHPALTAGFYLFYEHFLKGEGNGGLATGFCTSLSATVLEEFWTGSSDTFARISLDAATKDQLTAVHGRLLSRESLIDFHDQGRRGTANVATSYRSIESNLRDGGDRHSALMLFFVPSGMFWDEGYFDSLGDSHCIVPYRIAYPLGHDGTSIDGVEMYCWDCNHPFVAGESAAQNCRLVFRVTDGEIRFDYFDGGTSAKFSSEDGITLATMSNGKYLLSDHDMPFSGPFGLTTFVLDFLLSPADLVIENNSGQRTGSAGGSIVAEIPDSHPCYLVKGAYLLPADQALTRRIIGNDAGSYSYTSIAPNGVSITIEDITTAPGQEDVLAVNADGTSLRFTPGTTKNFTMTLAREVDGQARAVTITGAGGGPTTATDINLSPDLSIVRVANTDAARTVDVQVSQIVQATAANTTLDRNAVSVPTDHDLVVTVTDWTDLAVTVRALPFE